MNTMIKIASHYALTHPRKNAFPSLVLIALAIGLAQCLSLYAQYEMYKALLRFDFAMSYKISVSVITGLIYGGVGASCGAFLGGRLRRVAP